MTRSMYSDCSSTVLSLLSLYSTTEPLPTFELTDLSTCGFHVTPSSEIPAYTQSIWSGVTRRSPWPMTRLASSPPCHWRASLSDDL